MATKVSRRAKIKKRIRGIIKGDAQAPRLSVFRSNKQIYAQLVDDISGKTLAYAGSIEKEFAGKKIPKIEQAKLIGKAIAERAVKAGITNVRFDRNGYLYHGRVKSLAEGAREGGLKF